MLVGELREGVLLATIDNFIIWTSGGGLAKVYSMDRSGSRKNARMDRILYLGRNAKSRHKSTLMKCSISWKYMLHQFKGPSSISILSKKNKKKVLRGVSFSKIVLKLLTLEG